MANRRRFLIALAAAAATMALPGLRDLAPPGTIAGAEAATIRIAHRWPDTADPLLSGLVYWWRAAESGGTTLADASGNGNAGSLKAGAAVGSGYVTAGGSAAPADYVEAPASTGCAGATAFTLSAELYVSSSTSAGLIYLCDNGLPTQWRIALLYAATTRVVSVSIRDHDTAAASVDVTASALPAGAWTRVTLRVDTVADTVTIRVGANVTTQSVALGALGAASSAYAPAWGSNAGSSQLAARGAFRLRNAAKYSRALSDDEIDDLHTGWTPP